MTVLRPLLITTATADPEAHYADLQGHYKTLDDTPGVLDGQHPIRKWEYAMALRAFYAWKALPGNLPVRTSRLRIADVGGAGSNFYRAMAGVTGAQVFCIDPSFPAVMREEQEAGRVCFSLTVEETVHRLLDAVPVADREVFRFDVITCISVIEHVHETELPRFLDALTALLKRGGLLVLSTDYQHEIAVKDTKHYHWMRERIYDAELFTGLLDDLGRLGYNSLGAADFHDNGPQVFDYTMIAAALVYQPAPPPLSPA